MDFRATVRNDGRKEGVGRERRMAQGLIRPTILVSLFILRIRLLFPHRQAPIARDKNRVSRLAEMLNVANRPRCAPGRASRD